MSEAEHALARIAECIASHATQIYSELPQLQEHKAHVWESLQGLTLGELGLTAEDVILACEYSAKKPGKKKSSKKRVATLHTALSFAQTREFHLSRLLNSRGAANHVHYSAQAQRKSQTRCNARTRTLKHSLMKNTKIPFAQRVASLTDIQLMNIMKACQGYLTNRNIALLSEALWFRFRFAQLTRKKDVRKEGLFRLSGLSEETETIADALVTGQPIPNNAEIHAVATAWKRILRESPEPLMTRKLYYRFVSALGKQH
jgi:hypothetical protein